MRDWCGNHYCLPDFYLNAAGFVRWLIESRRLTEGQVIVPSELPREFHDHLPILLEMLAREGLVNVNSGRVEVTALYLPLVWRAQDLLLARRRCGEELLMLRTQLWREITKGYPPLSQDPVKVEAKVILALEELAIIRIVPDTGRRLITY